jgi:hypothetical protein
MKHVEKAAPIAAALTSLTTLVCCIPLGFATGAAMASLGMVVATYQRWFLGVSVVLLVVGIVQLQRMQRTCATRPYASIVVLILSAFIVSLVVLFPQVVAEIVADWLP